MIVGSQDLDGGRGEVDGLPWQVSVLAAGERQQRLEQPFLPVAAGDDALAHLPQGGPVRVGVGECHFHERELEGDLTAQLMSGVGECVNGTAIRHADKLTSPT